MRTLQSSVTLETYQKDLVDALQDNECLVFLDTNLLAWSFRLNIAAQREFFGWLQNLAQDQRLVIPAWTAHEYNHHLLQDDAAFFLPHKSVGKQLNANLDEIEKVAHLKVDDASAGELEYKSRDEFLIALSDATKIVRKCIAHLAKHDVIRRRHLVATWERIINETGLKSNVHELATNATNEAAGRYTNRLSPSYNDAKKSQNPNGDLIIWNEILGCCASKRASKAVLITNDRKSDWVYTPPSIVLPNGKTINETNDTARLVKLPKPDLVAEFERHTGGNRLYVLSVESVVEVLSSSELNRRDAQDFRHLALAIRLDLARSPTEAVVQWFLKNPDLYKEALEGVCHWARSPSEVDLNEFESWTVANMENVDAKKVRWGDVFCELFL